MKNAGMVPAQILFVYSVLCLRWILNQNLNKVFEFCATPQRGLSTLCVLDSYDLCFLVRNSSISQRAGEHRVSQLRVCTLAGCHVTPQSFVECSTVAYTETSGSWAVELKPATQLFGSVTLLALLVPDACQDRAPMGGYAQRVVNASRRASFSATTASATTHAQSDDVFGQRGNKDSQ